MRLMFAEVIDAWRRRSLFAKMFSYASIGVLNVVVDVFVFTIGFQFLHLPLVASNVLSWMVAATGSYIMNTKITFAHETGGALGIDRYLRFVISGVLGVTIGTTVLVLLTQITNVPMAKFASIIVSFFVNFCMSHFVVFRTASVREGN